MRGEKRIIPIFTAFILLFAAGGAFAWGVNTHESISEYALKSTNLKYCAGSMNLGCDFIQNALSMDNGLQHELTYNGMTNSITELIRAGASLEDTPPRWVNHFHDPVWSLGEWDKAGLLTPLGMSSPLWAQDLYYQNSFPAADDPNFWELVTVYPSLVLGSEAYKLWYGEPDWSWPAVREYFYTALTSGDDAARQEYFARTFRGVGHQMHLLEDMAVPEHVRTGGMA